MFQHIQELVNSLVDGDFTNYRNASKTRKILSNIKKEADKLRKQVLNTCKEANPKLFKQDQEQL